MKTNKLPQRSKKCSKIQIEEQTNKIATNHSSTDRINIVVLLAILFVPNGENNDMNIYLLEKGKINEEDWSILSILTSHQQQLIDLSGRDDNTNLFPFMSAAVSLACGLDIVYTLAMKNLEVIV